MFGRNESAVHKTKLRSGVPWTVCDSKKTFLRLSQFTIYWRWVTCEKCLKHKARGGGGRRKNG